ncbi:MAG TPA: hypothetical protein VGC66_08825 [Pyrinomonadaceae bacterium]
MRALSAALLTLALLSSAIPFTVMSAAHSCSMPCCAGMEGGCATGACKDALFKSPVKRPKKVEEEKLCGVEDAGEAHGAAKNTHPPTKAKASEDSDHCDSDKKEVAPERKETLTAESSDASSEAQANVISVLALASPCPKDCCAGASTSTQSRRGRDSAIVSTAGGLPPPSFISLSFYALNLQPVYSAHLKRLRGRAPPSLISSNPA